jgi:hypothetical protein
MFGRLTVFHEFTPARSYDGTTGNAKGFCRVIRNFSQPLRKCRVFKPLIIEVLINRFIN